MKIVVATPLYPPDPALTAAYIKDLAARLKEDHVVTVVAYAHIPESIPNVHMVAVDKRLPAPVRALFFAMALFREARRASLVLAVNGPSVDVPLLLFSYMQKVPILRLMHDRDALKMDATGSQSRARFSAMLAARTRTLSSDFPTPRPEIHPVEPYPKEQLARYEESWRSHLQSIWKTYGTA